MIRNFSILILQESSKTTNLSTNDINVAWSCKLSDDRASR